MAKTLAKVNKEMEAVLFNSEYTGSDATPRKQFPPVVNILQSDNQYKAFGEDGNKITKAMYGSLFVRSKNGNSLDDLKESITGTIVKIQQGADIMSIADDKIVASSSEMIPSAERENWEAANPGLKYKNMVKVIIALGDSKEVKKIIDAGKNPFAVVTVKGSGWGNWFDAQGAMDTATLTSEEYGYRSSSEVLVSAYRLTVKSREEKNEEFSWYVPTFEVELNTPDEAFALSEYVLEAKELDMFDRVNEMAKQTEVEAENEKALKSVEALEEPADLNIEDFTV